MNLAHLGEQNVERFGTYDAFFWQGAWHTNVASVESGHRFANVLVGLGVQPGDRVAVMLPNCLEVLYSYGGTTSMGGVVVPVVFLLAPGEIHHILADCKPKVFVTGPLFLDKAREAIQGLDDPPRLVVVGDPVPEGDLSWASLMAEASPEFTLVERADEDVVVIMYTGGTTGRPKGVLLSHANILWNAQTLTDAIQLPQGIMSVVTLPLAHLFGMITSVVGQHIGARGAILEWFTPDGVLQAIQEHRAEYLSLVPTMMTLLLHHEGAEEFDTSSLADRVRVRGPGPDRAGGGLREEVRLRGPRGVRADRGGAGDRAHATRPHEEGRVHRPTAPGRGPPDRG